MVGRPGLMWKERLQAQLVKAACQSPVHHPSFSEDQSECVSAPALGQVSGFTLPTTMPCSRHGDKPWPSQLLAMQRCCPRALRQGLPAGACLTHGTGYGPSIFALPAALKFPLGPCQAFTPCQLWWYLYHGITGKG